MAHEFSWSVSRHDTFNSCRRKYFYSYYLRSRRPRDPSAQEALRAAALGGQRRARDHRGLPQDARHHALPRGAAGDRPRRRARATARRLAGERSATRSRFRLFEHEYAAAVDAEDKKIVVGTSCARCGTSSRAPVLQEALAVGPRALAHRRGPRLLRRRRRARLPAHGPRLPRRAGPRGHRGLEDGPRRGPLQRGPARRLRALRGAAGLGGAARRRSRPSSPTSPSRATCAAAWTRASSTTRAPSSRRARAA